MQIVYVRTSHEMGSQHVICSLSPEVRTSFPYNGLQYNPDTDTPLQPKVNITVHSCKLHAHTFHCNWVASFAVGTDTMSALSFNPL